MNGPPSWTLGRLFRLCDTHFLCFFFFLFFLWIQELVCTHPHTHTRTQPLHLPVKCRSFFLLVIKSKVGCITERLAESLFALQSLRCPKRWFLFYSSCQPTKPPPLPPPPPPRASAFHHRHWDTQDLEMFLSFFSYLSVCVKVPTLRIGDWNKWRECWRTSPPTWNEVRLEPNSLPPLSQRRKPDFVCLGFISTLPFHWLLLPLLLQNKS